MNITLQNVFLQIPSYIFWKDLDLKYQGCNASLAAIAGLPSEREILGKSDFDLPWADRYANLYRDGDQEILDGKEMFHAVEPLLQADGRLVKITINKKTLYNRKKQKIGIVGSFVEVQDLTCISKRDDQKINVPLTQKQLDILCYLAKGFTAKLIAARLNISRRTVEAHIIILKQKFKIRFRTDLIEKAWGLDLVKMRMLELD
jgi:DNA-binding CsgD family transcriptional regulator